MELGIKDFLPLEMQKGGSLCYGGLTSGFKVLRWAIQIQYLYSFSCVVVTLDILYYNTNVIPKRVT